MIIMDIIDDNFVTDNFILQLGHLWSSLAQHILFVLFHQFFFLLTVILVEHSHGLVAMGDTRTNKL